MPPAVTTIMSFAREELLQESLIVGPCAVASDNASLETGFAIGGKGIGLRPAGCGL